jgi:hypothetical protein
MKSPELLNDLSTKEQNNLRSSMWIICDRTLSERRVARGSLLISTNKGKFALLTLSELFNPLLLDLLVISVWDG